jgi:hypothetical protein
MRSHIITAWAYPLFLTTMLVALGCNEGRAPEARNNLKNVPADLVKAEQAPAQAAPAGKQDEKAQPPAAVARRIIFNGTAELLVDDLAAADEQLQEIVKAHKAFLARSDMRTLPGSPRTAQWTVRVPVDQFSAFMTAVRKLGQVQRSNIDSQDVTEEFYDVEERIKNKKSESDSLRELLKKSATIPDILAVQEHLSKVTAELDLLQGRLKRLADLSALSTVTLDVREKKDYVPVEAPSFGTSIARTFGGSLEWMGIVGRGLTLAIVAVLPWLVVGGAVSVPTWWLVRRSRGTRDRGTTPPEVLPAGPPPAPPG